VLLPLPRPTGLVIALPVPASTPLPIESLQHPLGVYDQLLEVYS